MSLDELPPELLRHVASFLPVLDALRAARACRALADAVEEATWRSAVIPTREAGSLLLRGGECACAAQRAGVARLGSRLAESAEEILMPGSEWAEGGERRAAEETLQTLLLAAERWPRLRRVEACAGDAAAAALAARCPALESFVLRGGSPAPRALSASPLSAVELRCARLAPLAWLRAASAPGGPALSRLLLHRGYTPGDEDDEEGDEEEEEEEEEEVRGTALRALAARHGGTLTGLSLPRLPRGGAPALSALLPRLTELHLESSLHSPDGRRRASRTLSRALRGLPSLRRLSASCAAAAARAPRAFRRGSVRVPLPDLLAFLASGEGIERLELEGPFHCPATPAGLEALAAVLRRHGRSLEHLVLPKLFLENEEEGDEDERDGATYPPPASARAGAFLAALLPRCTKLRSLFSAFGGRGEELPREARRWRWGRDTGGGWEESEGSSSDGEGRDPVPPQPVPLAPAAPPPPAPPLPGPWLASLPPSLEALSVRGVQGVTPSDVSRLLSSRPYLRLALRRIELASAYEVGAWREASAARAPPAALYECDSGEGLLECADVCRGLGEGAGAGEALAEGGPELLYVM
eukprot:tig00021015_g17148.t1